MRSSKISTQHYLIRFEKGEEINSTLKLFCEEKGIKNATFLGIGSVENPTLAHYRTDTKKYSEKKLDGIFEILSLVGNVGLFEDKPLIHAHVTISDEDMKASGGHLVEGVVSATLEIFLRDLGSKHTKSFDEEIGLKLWDLPKERDPETSSG